MYSYKYPRPALTVDCAIFHQENNITNVLLIQRALPPFQGEWALPGGFVDVNEELEVAAARELAEETGLRGVELAQFHTFGTIGRDPRERTVSVVYYGKLQGEIPVVKGGDDATNARWFPISDLPLLAFDHQDIIARLIRHLKL